MGDEFRAGTSRNVQDPMTEGLDDMSVNSEAEFDNNEDCEEDVEEESVEVEEGEFDNNEDCEEDVEEESVEVEGEQCTNRWEGYEGVAINSKEDIVSLDLRTMGPDELSYCHFASLEVAYMFYNWYGRMNGFSARKGKIVRNNKGEAVKQTFLCHRQGFREDKGLTMENRKRAPRPETRCGCMARFRVHIEVDSQRWYVTCFDDDHNHEPVDEIYRGMLPGHRKMTDSDILQMNNLRKVGIGAPDIYNSFASQSGGYGNIGFRKKDIYNQIGKQRRVRGSDAASAVEYLRWLALNDPLMFVRHTEDLEGRLEHMFWCDGTSQMDYEVFGDVVAFDATYGKNKYRCPIVVFSGVNNHNHTIVFGTAVVANETEDTYVWLLEQFIEAMKGKLPTSVITDGDKAMRNAIRRVFPNAHHRLCAWHLIRNATSNIKNKVFVYKFTKCMLGDYDIGQFKRRWNSMLIEFGLEDNNWVKETYEKRDMWATAYIRGNFFAGFRTTSRCEGLHSLIGKYVRSRYNLTDFLQHFQRCLNYMRYKEIEADFASEYGEPVIQTNFENLERSAAKLLTREIFQLFRDVLGRASVMNVIDCRQTAGLLIYKVVRYMVTGREWHVTRYPSTNDFRCSCQRMESFGLPCGHVVAVLIYLNIDDLPTSLVLDRWSKGAKDKKQARNTDCTNFWDSHVIARYVGLLESCRELCTLASTSVADFNYARDIVSNIIIDMKKKSACTDDINRPEAGDSSLKDPAHARRRVGGTQNSASSGIKTKRTTRCGSCRVPGHNRLTCPLLREFDDMVENVHGTPLASEENDI